MNFRIAPGRRAVAAVSMALLAWGALAEHELGEIRVYVTRNSLDQSLTLTNLDTAESRIRAVASAECDL